MYPSKEMYLVEKNRPFYSTLNKLMHTYIFPREEDHSNLRPFYIKFTIVQLVGLLCYCGGTLLHLVMTLKDNTGVDVSEDIAVLFGNLGCIFICTMFSLRHSKWSAYFNTATNTTKFGKPSDFDAVTKRGNLFSTLNFWYVNIGITTYAAVSIAKASDCRRLKEDKASHELCGTFVPIWLPIEVDKLVVLIIIFIAQFITAYSHVCSSAMICIIPWEAAQIMISHINHFKSNFSKIFEEPTFQRRRDCLRFCVQYHIHILRMLDQLNQLVKRTVGIMTLICALVLACIENQLLKTKPMGAAIFLTGYIVALFWLCHAGQIVQNETLSISDILYDVNWYEVELSIMKDLKFIIARGQKPNTLDALPIGILSYVLFLTILKTSYSYLTLLNQST